MANSTGSMLGTKINNARTAAKLLVDLSKIGDYIGILQFTTSATEVFALTKIVDQATKNTIKAAIDNIAAGGGTGVGAVAQAALNKLTAMGAPEGNKVVYLLLHFPVQFNWFFKTPFGALGKAKWP
jgi:secreted protein with Ig-like and vWFA domain